jgi:hypothetical protein
MKSLLYHAFGVKGFRYLRTRYEGERSSLSWSRRRSPKCPPLKEELAELWEQKDGREAWGFLRECAKAKASSIRQLQAMAQTLLRHAKGVLSYAAS